MAEPALDPEADYYERAMRSARAAVRARAERSRLGAFTGAWGMVTGFALFIVIEESLNQWWLPVVAVILATAAAAVVEWLRPLAEGHESSPFTLAGVLSSLSLLLVMELFIFAFHDLAKNSTEWRMVFDHIFGATDSRGVFGFAAFFTLWVLLAANLGSILAQSIHRMPTEMLQDDPASAYAFSHMVTIDQAGVIVTERSLWIGLKIGLLAGFVYLPLTVFGYAIAVRLGWATVEYFASDRQEWPLSGETWYTYLAAFMFLGFIGSLLGDFMNNRRFVSAVFLLIYAGLQVYWLVAGDSTGTVATLGAQAWRTTVFALQTGAMWAAPAIVLGLLTPFLRKPSQYPWLWSPVALAAAAVAVVLVFVQQSLWLLLPAATLVAVGVLLRTRDRLDELWPLIAATVATAAFLAAAAMLQLAPLSMYRNLHAVVIPPGIGQMEWKYLEPRLWEVQDESEEGERLQGYADLDAWIRTFDPNAGLEDLPAGLRPPLVDVDREAMARYVDEAKKLDEAVLGVGEHGDNKQRVSRGTTFSLATISSLVFWLTMGLLAVWHLERARGKPRPDD